MDSLRRAGEAGFYPGFFGQQCNPFDGAPSEKSRNSNANARLFAEMMGELA